MTEDQLNALQAMVQEQLAKQSAPQQTPEQTQPQKFSFAGQEWNTKEEAEAAMARDWQAREARLRELEAISAQQRSAPPPQPQTPAAQPQFDQQRYFKLLTEDPVEAGKMQLRQILFGNANIEVDPAQFLQQTLTASIQTATRVAEMEMRANHPEVPWHDAKAMEAIEKMREARGLPNNPQGRELAIESLQARGLLPNRAVFEQQRQQHQPPASRNNVQQIPQRQFEPWETPRATPPPMIPSGSGAQGEMSQEDFNNYFENLPPEQMVAMRKALLKMASGE